MNYNENDYKRYLIKYLTDNSTNGAIQMALFLIKANNIDELIASTLQHLTDIGERKPVTVNPYAVVEKHKNILQEKDVQKFFNFFIFVIFALNNWYITNIYTNNQNEFIFQIKYLKTQPKVLF